MLLTEIFHNDLVKEHFAIDGFFARLIARAKKDGVYIIRCGNLRLEFLPFGRKREYTFFSAPPKTPHSKIPRVLICGLRIKSHFEVGRRFGAS